jgi:hypothetical protein
MLEHCNVQVLPKLMPEDFSFPDLGNLRGIPTVVEPKQEITCMNEGSIPSDEIRKVESNPPSAYLYLWGWVTYRDVFPGTPPHRTEYCLQLTKWGGDPLNPAGSYSMGFNFCPIHNCTDDECRSAK